MFLLTFEHEITTYLFQQHWETSMINDIIKLIKKYREIIVYIIVGIMATVVSFVSAALFRIFLNDQIVWQNVLINLLSWISANAFAYPANRAWVFKSKNQDVFRECFEFLSTRIVTGLVFEVGMMALLVNTFNVNFWISKIITTAFIMIANYVFSKLFVFRQKKKTAT